MALNKLQALLWRKPLSRGRAYLSTATQAPSKKRLSLDAFFSSNTNNTNGNSSSTSQYTLSEEQSLSYLRMASELSLLGGRSHDRRLASEEEEELARSRADFHAALLFIKKLEEVEVPEGTEPLGNVLEFYGGNQEKMRKAG